MGRERKKQEKEVGNFTGGFPSPSHTHAPTHARLLSGCLLADETVGATCGSVVSRAYLSTRSRALPPRGTWRARLAARSEQ